MNNSTSSVVQNRGMGYESEESTKVNVLAMKCLRSLVRASQMVRELEELEFDGTL